MTGRGGIYGDLHGDGQPVFISELAQSKNLMTTALSERARELGAWLRRREEICRRNAAEQPDQLAFADNAEEYKSRAECVESLLAEREWRPIETAPKQRVLLLFAITDVADDGHVRNWRMETGFYHDGWPGDGSPWNWGGNHVAAWECKPTHWLPLPLPPP